MSATENTNALSGPGDGAVSLDHEDPRYRNIAREIARKPWAMLPSTLAVMVDLLRYRSAGHRLTRAEVEERIAEGQMRAAGQRSAGRPAGTVAVIPLYGIIAARAAAFQSVSSPNGTSVEEFMQMFRAALADDSVDSILIEIDSPGGSVDMVPELAATVRAARGGKPIVAIANTLAASAAYWIGSQADELVVTPSGEVGSIGVYAAHEDLSGALEQEGVKVTLISAGKFKTEGNPFEPLSEEALAYFQSQVDDFYAMFVADVAKGRGVTVADVRDGFGQGRVVSAADAVKAGMADRVATFDDTVARMMRGAAPARVALAEANVSRLALEPGDHLLVTIKDPAITSEQLARIKYTLEERFPGHNATVIGPNAELAVISGAPGLAAGPVPAHSTEVIDEPWDGPGQEAKLAEPITKARGTGMYAWYDDNGKDPDGDGYPDAKADWKFPHHMVSDGNPGPANVNGVRNGLARLSNSSIPEADKAGVKAHLQRHLDDFNARSGKGAQAQLVGSADETTRELEARLIDRETRRPKEEQ